jgi:predicted enzyme related to lactoylglutathione lyase
MIGPDGARYTHGTIGWTELFVGDVARQRDFYAALLGWRFDAQQRARDDSGRLVAALRPRHDRLRGWIPGIAVEDVGAVQRAVIAASGKVHRDGALADPLGGRFLIWDGRFFDGAHGLNATGGLAWNEVWTADAPATIAFYRRVLGWNLRQQPGRDGAPYTMVAGRDRPGWTHAGICPLPPSDAAARWISYFAVARCDESVDVAHGLGAAITQPATHVPGVGWIATAVDREGAAFGLLQSGA